MKDDNQDNIDDTEEDGAGGLAPETLSALDNMANELGGEGGDDDETQGLETDLMTAAQVKEEEKQKAQARKNKALVGAYGLVNMLEKGIQYKYDYIAIDDAGKAELVQAFAPVLEKHDAGMPEWLEPYKEELKAGIALGGLLYGVYDQVQKHEAAAAKAQQDNQDDDTADQQQQRPAPSRPTLVRTPPVSVDQDIGGLLDLGRQMENAE